MGKRKTNLTPPTEAEVAADSSAVRSTPHGGWAWKCAHCGLYASSVTPGGMYVCYKHGGMRALNRDPVKRQEARERGETPPRPPGRPLKHGLYSSSKPVKVQELVRTYQESGLDPDDTDPDMLHLRARLENLIALEPSTQEVTERLQAFLEDLRAWRAATSFEAERLAVENVLETLDRLRDLAALVQPIRAYFSEYMNISDQIESRHHELIKRAKDRADTRVKLRAAEDTAVFEMLLRRFMMILVENLPPDCYRALQKRIEKDLDEVPSRAVEAPSSAQR